MSQALTIANVVIPEGLATQLRIRAYRLDVGQDPQLEYHPLAGELARRLWAAMPPTTPDLVRKWLIDLTAGLVLAKDGPSLEARVGATFLACSEFPAAVWNALTLKRALQTFAFFPVAAEVYRFLKPDVDEMLSVVRGLEAIAQAPHAERAVAAREVYKPPPPPDWVGLRRGRGDHSSPRLWTAVPPQRTPAEQIAILRGEAG